MKELFLDEQDQWRFRVKGRNGEILATSEGYTRKHDAERGLETLTLTLVGLANCAPVERS
jgi:uncharacterized protein YegP (UPF0339 family)